MDAVVKQNSSNGAASGAQHKPTPEEAQRQREEDLQVALMEAGFAPDDTTDFTKVTLNQDQAARFIYERPHAELLRHQQWALQNTLNTDGAEGLSYQELLNAKRGLDSNNDGVITLQETGQ